MERSETLTLGAYLSVNDNDRSPIFQCAIEARESIKMHFDSTNVFYFIDAFYGIFHHEIDGFDLDKAIKDIENLLKK